MKMSLRKAEVMLMFDIDFEDGIVEEIDNHPIIDYMDSPSISEMEEMFDRGYFG